MIAGSEVCDRNISGLCAVVVSVRICGIWERIVDFVETAGFVVAAAVLTTTLLEVRSVIVCEG